MAYSSTMALTSGPYRSVHSVPLSTTVLRIIIRKLSHCLAAAIVYVAISSRSHLSPLLRSSRPEESVLSNPGILEAYRGSRSTQNAVSFIFM